MKLFFLILSLFGFLSAMAQVGEDPNESLYKGDTYSTAGVLDLTSSHGKSMTAFGTAQASECYCNTVPQQLDMPTDGDTLSQAASDKGGSTEEEGSQGP